MGTGPTTRGGTPAANAAAPPDPETAALVNALATALRNIAIYPATHPRVGAAADDFVARLAARGQARRTVVIGQRNQELVVDGARYAVADGQPSWLLQRFRDAGLRGVAFEPECTPADVVEFAQALNGARARTGVAFASLWPADHARLHAHDLVFTGTFKDGGPEAAPAADAAAPTQASGEATPAGAQGAALPTEEELAPRDSAADRRRQQILAQLASDAKVGQRLVAIELACNKLAPSSHQELDLLTAVTDLLPADVATHPELVVSIVSQILEQVEKELPELVQRNAQVEGAELLRMALGVARKYFHTEAPKQPLQRNLPTGRPEDEGIQGNLELLLQELAALPDQGLLRLPPADELQAAAPTMATELLGIHLHSYVATDRAEIRTAVRPRLVQLLHGIDRTRRALLLTYLGAPGEPAPVTDALRTQLLAMLVEAGQGRFVREQGYVDAAFVTRGFPESLPVAARVLGKTPDDLEVLRRGFEALAPMLSVGGVDAAVKSGVLRDDAVVDLLLRLPGSLALPLLPHVAVHGGPEVRRRLCAFLKKLKLPAAEAAALQGFDPPESIAPPYLRDLLRAAAQSRVDATLRTATGAVLREHVQRGLGRLPQARLLEAIDTLQLVPGPETLALLQTLATRGRFTKFGAQARAIRRTASELLARATRGAP